MHWKYINPVDEFWSVLPQCRRDFIDNSLRHLKESINMVRIYLYFWMLLGQYWWERSQRREYQRVTKNLVSVSCVASSAEASEGWWTTCTGITRTTSRGSVTSVTLGRPSPRLCTDTSNRFTTPGPASAQSVGRVSVELRQWCSTSVRWEAKLSKMHLSISLEELWKQFSPDTTLFSTNLTAVPAPAQLVPVKLNI